MSMKSMWKTAVIALVAVAVANRIEAVSSIINNS